MGDVPLFESQHLPTTRIHSVATRFFVGIPPSNPRRLCAHTVPLECVLWETGIMARCRNCSASPPLPYKGGMFLAGVLHSQLTFFCHSLLDSSHVSPTNPLRFSLSHGSASCQQLDRTLPHRRMPVGPPVNSCLRDDVIGELCYRLQDYRNADYCDMYPCFVHRRGLTAPSLT